MPAPEGLAAELSGIVREAQADNRLPSVSAAAVREGEIVWSEYIGDGGALVLVMTGPLDNWKCGRGYPGRRVKLMSCRSPAPPRAF